MDSRTIIELLKFGEHINLECKKAESKLPNSVWETYSSFANTDGGIILFGVEEHARETSFEKRFTFVSIKNPEQRLKDFWNTVNSEKVEVRNPFEKEKSLEFNKLVRDKIPEKISNNGEEAFTTQLEEKF